MSEGAEREQDDMSGSDEEAATSPMAAAAAAAAKADAGRAKNVNLFFGTRSELADVAKKDDASTAYIIFQNDRLHSNVDRLQKRIKDAERDLHRATDDSDRAERSRTCLRGMLHNEIEKGRISRDVNAMLQEHNLYLGEVTKKTGTMSVVHASVALGVHALAWLWPDGSLDSLALAVHLGNAAVFGWMYCCARSQTASRTLADRSALAEMEKQLASASRGTDHLHDIVDEL